MLVEFGDNEVKGTAEYAADQSTSRKRKDRRVFVLLLLGTEPLDLPEGEKGVDPNAVLMAMGWTPPAKEPEPKPDEEQTTVIEPWFHTAANYLVKVKAERDSGGKRKRLTGRMTAADLGCNATQLRQIAAGRYQDKLKAALKKHDLVLLNAEYEKKQGRNRPAQVAITFAHA